MIHRYYLRFLYFFQDLPFSSFHAEIHSCKPIIVFFLSSSRNKKEYHIWASTYDKNKIYFDISLSPLPSLEKKLLDIVV